MPFEGVPASLGPGLRTVSGTMRSLGEKLSPSAVCPMTGAFPARRPSERTPDRRAPRRHRRCHSPGAGARAEDRPRRCAGDHEMSINEFKLAPSTACAPIASFFCLKSFLDKGIGNGALRKSAKKRQKAPRLSGHATRDHAIYCKLDLNCTRADLIHPGRASLGSTEFATRLSSSKSEVRASRVPTPARTEPRPPGITRVHLADQAAAFF